MATRLQVYVYTRASPTSSWTWQATLQASTPAQGALFGQCVALSADGNTVAVGAMFDPVSGKTQQGSAFVFVRAPGASTWGAQTPAPITMPVGLANSAGGDYFGASCAVRVGAGCRAAGGWMHAG